jgi:hypothetical protein
MQLSSMFTALGKMLDAKILSQSARRDRQKISSLTQVIQQIEDSSLQCQMKSAWKCYGQSDKIEVNVSPARSCI